jgi:protein-S-isoprenylcysteine O-methyltransferase Ste14
MLGVVLSGVFSGGRWYSLWGFGLGGLFLGVSGVLGTLALRDLGTNRTSFPQPMAQSALVQQGIYSWIRHPLYTSAILASFGWSLVWASWVAGVLALALTAFLEAKSRREEAWLRQRYPEYAAYAARVRRFIPWIY